MIDLRVDVGEETVLLGVLVIPRGVRLFVSKVKTDDGFAVFEAILPWRDDADGGSVLIGKNLSVTAEGEQRQRIHGLIETKAFGVGPVVAEGQIGHLFLVDEGE